jgi:hypothetical protein
MEVLPQRAILDMSIASATSTATDKPGRKLQVETEESEKRFTIDGSQHLEQQLAGLCEAVLAGVNKTIPPQKLEALVLGGGYGRGQGGVLKTERGDQPYNDLEFYVFLHGNRVWNERKFSASLHALGESLSPQAGLHVEFKVESLERLRRNPVTMFSYDLISGHRVVFPARFIFSGCEHHLASEKISLSEATRLLFNRCTGLLLAKEMLVKTELTAGQSDFVGRNLAKAQLALGDVVLTAAGQYHWSCTERHDRLRRLFSSRNPEPPWLAAVLNHHAHGVDFKLHPRRLVKSRQALMDEFEPAASLAQQLWLWLESQRLNQSFASIREYAYSPTRKCFESAFWRNWLLNLKVFGPRVLFDTMAGRYPRERLLNALPLLLWEEPFNDLRVKRILQKQLRTRASDWQSCVAAYKSFWPGFS